jgi:hypothetical protein
MRAHREGLGLAAWREAWRARCDNPLPRLWRLGGSRQEQRRAWWRQAPGLTLLGLAVSAAVTYLLVLIIRQFLALHTSALATTSYALGILRAGTLMLACGAMVLSGGWLLSRLYACAHLALSLLSRSQRKHSENLDDALLASALSNEQVVLGLVLHAWRMLLPPALVLNIANAAAYFIWVALPPSADNAQALITQIPWWETLLIALAFLLIQSLAALIGAALLMLLLLMLGRGAGPLAPATGAATLVMLQLGLWIALLVIIPRLDLSDVEYASWLYNGLALVLAYGLFIGYFWVAHRKRLLRNATAHTLLLFVALLAAMMAKGAHIAPHYFAFFGLLTYLAGWLALCLSLLPAGGSSLIMVVAGSVEPNLGYSLLAIVKNAGYMAPMLAMAPLGAAVTLFQLMLCIQLAQLARDAVRLHRGGAA